jgi:hypothetical protein
VCKNLLPNGDTTSPQEQAKQHQEALKYASCIRAHGMPDYPDPKAVSDGGIEMGEAPDSPRLSSRPPRRRVDTSFRTRQSDVAYEHVTCLE